MEGDRLKFAISFCLLVVITSPEGFAEEAVCQLCACTLTWRGQLVKCSGKNLTVVPRGFPVSSDKLYLDKTNLTRISNGDFWNLENLTFLHLGLNNISHLDSGSFKNLTSLEVLHLEYNNIKYIHKGCFTGLKRLQTLFLSYNKINYLESGSFDNLVGLKTLYLTGNQMTKLSDRIFRGLNVLNTLFLSYNNITVLKSKNFEYLTMLAALYLDGNEITFIHNGSFANLTRLTRLSLEGNRLTNISCQTFQGLTALKGLYLDDNSIERIAPGGFEDLGSLTDLSLRKNKIHQLLNGVFRGLDYLKQLFLENNNIAYLQEGCFQNLTHLLRLHLEENYLANISWGVFRGLHTMRYLHLDNNDIQSMRPGGFEGLSHLTELKLQNNNITEILNGTFRGLDVLNRLNLTDNRIQYIEPGTFLDVIALRNLELNGNEIAEIYNNTFDGLQHSIQDISLDNNFIKNLTPGTFRIFSKSRFFNYLSMSGNELQFLKNYTFSGLNYLRTLYLDNNNIQGIEASAFYRMRKIFILHLNGNRLRKIINGTFYYRRTLSVLDLSDNNISSLPEGVFAKLRYLRILRLSKNPLQHIKAGVLRGLYRLENLHMELCGIREIEPKSFASSKALYTLNLARNYLTKINNTTFSGLDYLNALYLQMNEIQEIERDSFKKKYYLMRLFLHGNRLSKISKGVFDSLIKCKFLTLNNNNISEIEKDAFQGLKTIETIFLQYNRLKRVKKEDFASLMRLERLYLFDNQISSIEMGSFPHWHLPQLLLYKNSGLSSITVVAGEHQRPNVTVYMYPESVPSIPVHDGVYASVLEKNGFQCEMHDDNEYILCDLCSRGTYSRGDGVSKGCWECPAGGFYQDSVAAVGLTKDGNGCQRCPVGTFVHPKNAPGKISWDCKACPEGTNTTMFAGFRACRCLKNYYRLDHFGPCAACPGHGVECSNDKLNLSRGFYWEWANNSRNDNKSTYKLLVANLAIESDRYNNKTMQFIGEVPKAYKCPREDSCLGGIDSECAEGYAGPLCAICKSGYYKRSLSCHKCPSKKLIGIQFGVLALIILVIVLVILKSNKFSTSGRRTIADIFLAHVKIVIGFYQVLAGVLQAFSYVKWPSEVSVLESYIRFVQLNVLQIVSPSCVEETLKVNAYSHFVFTLAGNVCIVILPIFCYLVRLVWIKLKGQQTDGIEATDIKKSYLKVTMFLLFAAYPATCVNIFQILPLSCHELCPYEGAANCPSFLRADYSIKCDTDQHRKYVWAAYASLWYVVGFPIFLTFIVWKNHLRARNRPRRLSITESRSNINSMAFAILFLHENYSSSCWYWESIEMARKVILSAGVIFVGSESRTQVGIAAMVSASFAMLHGRFRPIPDRFEDYLQMMSLLVTSFNLSIGVLLKMPSDEVAGNMDVSNDNEALGILLLFTNGLVISALFVRYVFVFMRFAMNCRSNSRLSWSCIWMLLRTAQQAQSDVTDVSSHKTSSQAIAKGSDYEIPAMVAAVNESFVAVGQGIDNDEDDQGSKTVETTT